MDSVNIFDIDILLPALDDPKNIIILNILSPFFYDMEFNNFYLFILIFVVVDDGGEFWRKLSRFMEDDSLV